MTTIERRNKKEEERKRTDLTRGFGIWPRNSEFGPIFFFFLKPLETLWTCLESVWLRFLKLNFFFFRLFRRLEASPPYEKIFFLHFWHPRFLASSNSGTIYKH